MPKRNRFSVKNPATNNVASSSGSSAAEANRSAHALDCTIENEYWNDIWEMLVENAAALPKIVFQSPQLEFRGSLVKMLRDASTKLKFSTETLHTAVSLLDQFMDAHRISAERLIHVALVCLSLAAKCGGTYTRRHTMKRLSLVTGVHVCPSLFTKIEWKVGQYVGWRLTSPTPATFASLLSRYLITYGDVKCRRPAFLTKFKRDADTKLEEYLDLTLSDVKLKALDSVDVGCACVSCARIELGLSPWSPALAAAAARTYDQFAPVAKRLHKMMTIMKHRGDRESLYNDSLSIPDHENTTSSGGNPSNTITNMKETPPHVARDPADFTFYRAASLLEPNSVDGSTNMAVKRNYDSNSDIEFENKRLHLTTQMSQIVL